MFKNRERRESDCLSRLPATRSVDIVGSFSRVIAKSAALFLGLVALAGASAATATPTAGNVSLTVLQNAPAAYPNVVAAVIITSGTLTITSVSSPSHGASSVVNNTVTYTPAVGYVGSDSFTYTASDGQGSATATVNVTVIAPPPPPASKQLSASMVTPANAWSHYGTATTHTADPSWAPPTPEIPLLAKALGANRLPSAQFIAQAYKYMQNAAVTEFRFGLGKGARGVLIDGSGTPFDQAQLLAKILQQGGVATTYQVGNVTLTAQQFGAWTGVVTNVNQSAQTFTVNAQAACHFLADGGIPAIINGVVDNGTQDYCNTQVTGNLTSVTMAHVWVSAGGYLLDPSFKQNTVQAGIDLAAAMGCGNASSPTCASTTQAAAMNGATTGTLGSTSAPTIANLNESAVLAQLTSYATALEGVIKSNAPGTPLQAITSGVLPNPAYVASNPPASVLPYSVASTVASWSGDIPDQYRAAVTYQFCAQSVTFYADVLSGRRLRRWVVGQPTTTSITTGGAGALQSLVSTYVDGADIMDCAWPYGTPSFSAATTFTVQLPYAAAGYGAVTQSDYVVEAPLYTPTLPLNIVFQLGEASDSTVKFFGDVEGDDQVIAQANSTTGIINNSYINCSNTTGTIYGCNPQGSTTGAHLLADQSRAAGLLAQVSNAAIRHHVRIGYVEGSFFESSQQLLNVSSNVSTESYLNNSAATSAAFEVFAHASSALEGSVSQQEDSTYEPFSGSSSFVFDNRGGIAFADISPANMATAIPSLTNYGTRTTVLQTLANGGYESILPVNGVLPCSASMPYCGFGSPDYEIQQGAVGLLLEETYKGAAVLTGTDPTAGPLAMVKQKAEARQSLHLGAVVDTASGQISLRPPADIVTGVGDFPESLPFQRFYQSNASVVERRDITALSQAQSWSYLGPDSKSADHLGGGWQHNYQITAQLDSDASLAMGDSQALDASGMITGAYVLNQLLQNPTFPNRMSAILVDYWMTKQIFNHVVHVKVGEKATDFALLPDGKFAPPPGGADVLTQTGAPVLKTAFGDRECLDLPALDFSGITFKLVGGDGETVSFDAASLKGDSCTTYGYPDFKGDSISYPDGNVVQIQYTPQTLAPGEGGSSTTRYVISKVSNSFGRSLSFATTWAGTYYVDQQGFNVPIDAGWVINSVTDENGRTATFARSNCPTYYANHGSAGVSPAVGGGLVACNTLTATPPDQNVWTYSYLAGSDSPDPAIIERAPYHLRRWYVPLNSSSPFETYAYDGLYRISTITDARSNVSSYYPSSFFPTDLWKQTDSVDALGFLSHADFDRWNDVMVSIDPLGRTTTHSYDAARRHVLDTLPAGDATSYTYDVRSNILTTTRIPKPSSTLANIVTSATYNEGASVYPCASPNTCNKPATQTDARGAVTNYSWNGLGQLTRVLRPADSSGARPETDYSYTLEGSNNQISLLTQSSRKVSATANQVKGFAYNSVNKYVLSTATDDPGGLNLITTFTFDGIGNLTTVQSPRTDVVSVSNYTWDPNRRLIFSIDPTPSSGARPATKFTYDANGEQIQTDKGTTTQVSGSDFIPLETTTYGYDAAGNKITDTVLNGTSTPALAVTNTSYDKLNRVYQVTDPVGRVTQNVYDAAGQKTGELRAVGTGLQQTYAGYSYNLDGLQNGVLDANGNFTAQGRDGFNRPQTTYYPSTSKGSGASDGTDYELLSYDANGNKVSVRKRDGAVISYAYDALNRETQKVVPANGSAAGGAVPGYSVFTTYDLADRPLSVTFSSTSGPGVAYTYDAAGRRVTEANNGLTLTSSYDGASNRTGLTWPDGDGTTFSYDPLDRMTVAAGTAVNFAYDPLSRRSGITRVNGTSTSYGYDAADRLTALSQNLTSPSANVAFTYAYTAASQVSSRSISNTTYQWTNPSTSTLNYTADGLNRDAALAATAGGYDANGNLTYDGSRTFAYDEENHLVSVSSGGSQTLALSYDSLGRLQQTTAAGIATQFVYDGDNLTEELDGTGAVLRRYVHGPGQDDPVLWLEGSGLASPRFPYADHQGSIIGWSDASGNSGATYAYGPYGERSTWSGSRFAYTGQIELPEAQLYYYKARIYDPVRGRFLQTDTVGYQDDLNLYSYAGDDPVNGEDASGTAREASLNVVQGPGSINGQEVCKSAGCKEEEDLSKRNAADKKSATSRKKPIVTIEEADIYWRNARGNPLQKIGEGMSLDAKSDSLVGLAKDNLLDALRAKDGFITFGGDQTTMIYVSPSFNEASVVKEFNQIRIELANADSQLTTHSASNIKAYHQRIFAEHGLPATVFGGTMFTGTSFDLFFTKPFWCNTCAR